MEGAALHGFNVVEEIRRTHGVDAHDGAIRVQVTVNDVGTGLGAVLGAAAVLEVEDHHVGTVCGFSEALGAIGRNKQQRGAGGEPG